MYVRAAITTSIPLELGVHVLVSRLGNPSLIIVNHVSYRLKVGVPEDRISADAPNDPKSPSPTFRGT